MKNKDKVALSVGIIFALATAAFLCITYYLSGLPLQRGECLGVAFFLSSIAVNLAFGLGIHLAGKN